MPIPTEDNRIDEEKRKRRKETVIFYRILAVCMAILLLLVFVLNLVLPDREFSDSEKRMLAQKPELSFNGVVSGEFGNAFEEYASDQMILRDPFVSLKAAVDGLLGEKESQGVYRGKNGFLIQKMEEPDENALSERLEAMKTFAETFPSDYSLVLVPNAVSLYPEKLPLFAVTADQGAFSENVQKGLAGSSVRYLDLTDTLLTEKERTKELLYYRTDHHWTTLAAYLSRGEVLKMLGKTPESEWKSLTATEHFRGSLASKSGFSVTKEDTITIYTPEQPLNYLVSSDENAEKRTSVYSMEGLCSSDPYTVFLGGNEGSLHIGTDRKGGGSLLVFKDSYFNCFLPFLLEEYESIDVVDPRYFSGNLRDKMYANQYDSVLFFYNMSTFSEDSSLAMVLSEAMTEGNP